MGNLKRHDVQLTKNFNLREFLVSRDHPELVPQLHNFLTWIEQRELFLLCYLYLQPLRESYGVPIYVSSGFRTPMLNELVGGVERSNHMTGSAADIYVADKSLLPDMFKWLATVRGKELGELIYHKKEGYIHIALPKHGKEQIIKEV